jgi:maleylacetoacetate isomerase
VKLFSFWRSLATFRVRIALNLKGITPDEVIDVNLPKGQQREERFRKINPMMALPALIEDDGTVLFESLAILEYLDETHPNPPLLPKAAKARARARALAQICACDTHPLIVPRVREYLEHEYRVDAAGVAKWGYHWHETALQALEANLAGSKETGRYAQGDAITVARRGLFQVRHRAVSDLQAHRRHLLPERGFRPCPPTQAAGCAGVAVKLRQATFAAGVNRLKLYPNQQETAPA